MTAGRVVAALAALAVAGFVAVMALFAALFMGVDGGQLAGGLGAGAGGAGVVADGSLTIKGPSALTVADLVTWWSSSGRGQPDDLRAPIVDVFAWYLSEGAAEGVRGDMALAQAVLETGYFTNGDTSINNFAGIAHYDNTDSGSAFSDVRVGVRAQIQLLRKFMDGNDIALANPDVSPDAGAHADTWAQLAGTWATSKTYWTSLLSVYRAMSATAVGGTKDELVAGVEPAGSTGQLVDVGPCARAAGCQLDATWAPHLEAALRDAATAGFPTEIVSANRTHAEQAALYARNCPVPSCPGGLTAVPGTSNHEGGLAVDLRMYDGLWGWLHANGARYGVFQDLSITERDWVHWSATGH